MNIIQLKDTDADNVLTTPELDSTKTSSMNLSFSDTSDDHDETIIYESEDIQSTPKKDSQSYLIKLYNTLSPKPQKTLDEDYVSVIEQRQPAFEEEIAIDDDKFVSAPTTPRGSIYAREKSTDARPILQSIIERFNNGTVMNVEFPDSISEFSISSSIADSNLDTLIASSSDDDIRDALH